MLDVQDTRKGSFYGLLETSAFACDSYSVVQNVPGWWPGHFIKLGSCGAIAFQAGQGNGARKDAVCNG